MISFSTCPAGNKCLNMQAGKPSDSSGAGNLWIKRWLAVTQLSDAGQKVFNARYALRDEEGRIIETFEQAVYRLARAAERRFKQG
jgi:hypothetical protein